MIIIINLSVIKLGGGLQVGHSFLEELKFFTDNEYHIILLHDFKTDLVNSDFPSNFNFYWLEHSPSELFYSYKIIKKLTVLENVIKPDIVFTLFGPSYWKPKAPHLCGYALPHFVYPKSPFYQKINLREKIKLKLLGYLKLFLLKKQAGFLVTETEDVSNRLADKCKISRDRIFTVSNTYNNIFNQPEKWNRKTEINEKGFKMITISSFYKHKNLDIVLPVINYLNLNYPDFEFTFILTIEEKSLLNNSKISHKNLKFLGKVGIDECPHLYSQVDALFMPTLLECFSASYLEAMKMNLPILTSDLSFASDICENSASYFNPMSPRNIGEAIVKLASDFEYRKSLVENGNSRLKEFATANQRTEKYLDIMKSICSGEIKSSK